MSLSAPPRLGPPRPSGCMRARHGAGAYHSRPRPGLPGSRRRAHPAGPVPGDNQTSKGRRPHGAVSPRHELAGSRRSAPIGSADQGFALERGCARGGRGWRFRIRHAPCLLPAGDRALACQQSERGLLWGEVWGGGQCLHFTVSLLQTIKHPNGSPAKTIKKWYSDDTPVTDFGGRHDPSLGFSGSAPCTTR